MLFVRPLIMYLMVFLVLMCMLELVSAATLAQTMTQTKANNKTHSPLRSSVRSSVPTPTFLSNVIQSKDSFSSTDQQVSASTQIPLERLMLDSILQHQQLHHLHGKSSIIDINLILESPSQLTMSTEAPSTTTAIPYHYTTTQRSNRKKRSILNLPNFPSRYLGHEEINHDNFESEWSSNDEEEEEESDGIEDESIDYDELDFSQPNHQLVVDESVDLSVRPTNGVNQNDNPGRIEESEEDADEDIILVIGPITTLKPSIKNSFETENVSIEHTTEQQQSLTPIGLNEWPVQVGLQARTKQQVNTVTKLVNSQMGNGNGLQTILVTHKFNDQQSGNKNEGNSERLDFNESNENIADSHDGSVTARSQFMNSPAIANRQMNKTKQQESSIGPLEIVDRIMPNHYGNPIQYNPTASSTIPIPDILRDVWYAGSEEENYQKPTTTTTEPDEAYYYINNSEEETDRDLYLDYPEEKEDDTKPTSNAEIVNNSGTITRRPSTTNVGRGPYFVSSVKVEPFEQKIDVISDEIGMILNPIGVIDRRMDFNTNSGINFVEAPDFIDPSAYVIPFPTSDPIIPINQPSMIPHQQQSQKAILPAGRTGIFQDNFVVNSNHVQPIVELPIIETKLISDSPGPSKGREPPAYVIREEIAVTQNPIGFQNANSLYVDSNASPTITRLDRLPYPVMVSSSTDDDIAVTFTPSPTRPFIQSPYVTWATTKAKSGPYFVNSAETAPQNSGVYNTGQGMRKRANETIENPTGIISNTDTAGRTKSTSASRGRPPYFVSSTPMPLFQSIPLNESTRKLTDITKTTLNDDHNVTNNQQTMTTLGPESIKENFKTENSFVTSGPIRPSLQPPYMNVARSNNTVRPMEFNVGSSESDIMDQKLDIIDMKESVGIIPNRIGIRNKNNVFIVPKPTASSSGTVQMQNISFPADVIKKVEGQSNMNTSNQQHANRAVIVKHGMGSFVITSSPVQSSAQQVITHPSVSESSITTTVASVVAHNVVYPKESENTSYEFDKHYNRQEEMKIPMGILQNPIGISNKNNVFVVPKSTSSGTARQPIPSATFPADLLMKRHGLRIDNEQPVLRPFERIVNHQMGSFVVTTKPDDGQIRLDITTAASIEQSLFSDSLESVQQIRDISNPKKEVRVIVKNSTSEIKNPKPTVKSAVSTSTDPGRPPYFAKSSTAAPLQPIYLNQHSMSKLVEEIAKIQRISGNLKENADLSVDVAQPPLSSFRTGQMKSIMNKNNNQQHQLPRMNFRRPAAMTESRTNSLNGVTMNPNSSRQPVNLSSNNRTPKNPTSATKSSKRKKTTNRS